jgi:hypothetical protein
MNLLSTARVHPPIRSSAIKVVGDPFLYYLTEILGITSAFNGSRRMAYGSYEHEALRLFDSTPEARKAHIESILTTRQSDIREAAKQFNVTPDSRDRILSDEEYNALTALSYWESANLVRRATGTLSRGIGGWLGNPRYKVIGRELLVTVFPWGEADLPAVAQFDLLLYEPAKNLIHIVDLKTTSSVPIKRASYASKEFQTHHYLHIAREAARLGLFDNRTNSSMRPTVGSMAHLIIQTPTIRFGQNDRSFTLDTSPLKSGKRKGQPRNEKRYSGEPKLENFLTRTSDWYLGRNDYVDRALLVLGDQSPVNVSWTPIQSVSARDWDDYDYWTTQLRKWGSTSHNPLLFPKNITNLMHTTYSDESPYTDFYMTDPSQWPEVMRRHRLVVDHRDPQLDLIRTPSIVEN